MKQRLTGASRTAAVITSLSLLFIASIVFSSITGEIYAAALVFSTYVYPSSIRQYSCADLHDVSLHPTNDQRFGAFSLKYEEKLTPFRLAAKVSLERISDFLRETELLDEFDTTSEIRRRGPSGLFVACPAHEVAQRTAASIVDLRPDNLADFVVFHAVDHVGWRRVGAAVGVRLCRDDPLRSGNADRKFECDAK